MGPEPTPDLVLEYREIGKTMTHQVPWEKIQDLRRGNLFMTVPNNEHFRYLSKFIQPLLVPPEQGTVGIVSLSSVLERRDVRDGGIFRRVTHWRIRNVKLSMNEEDWIMGLGPEVKDKVKQ